MRLVIRKVQYAPEKPGPQPMVETTRSFLMSDRSLHLEASLDKEVRADLWTHRGQNFQPLQDLFGSCLIVLLGCSLMVLCGSSLQGPLGSL